MTDVILLHGAWHQPAHYAEVVGLLRSQDVSVEVPDLYEPTACSRLPTPTTWPSPPR